MKARFPAACAAVAIVVGLLLAAGNGAAGVAVTTVSIDVATMAYHADATEDAVCGVFTPSVAREFNGTVGSKGTYIASVNLPKGVRIRSLRLVVRDNDSGFDTYAFLVRKRMAPQPGLDGFQGYKVLAHTKSAGASNLLRRFTTTSVSAPVVDQATSSYFAEIVNCVDTIDPIGVQISWTHP